MQLKIIYTSILAVLLWSFSDKESNNSQDALILFVSGESSVINDEQINDISGLAEKMNLDFHLIDDTEGLPEDIHILPSLYLQNNNGRTRYYGRYSNIPRIKNFIRTSKMFHSKDETYTKKEILAWQDEKALITAPIKVTDLTGVVPDDFDQDLFKREVHQSISKGMRHFQLQQQQETDKQTRSLYFNIYPYRDEYDKLSISYEIFSQYNCIKPVVRKRTPILEPFKWKKRESQFQLIGKSIEEEIIKHIRQAENGDAFTPVASATKNIPWDALGLESYKGNIPNQEQNLVDPHRPIPRKWKVNQKADSEDPIIIFSFLSPVDNYAGEVTALNGEMNLGEGPSINGANGKFTVKISDVTMGAEDLDDAVRNEMLKSGLFPNAHFTFENIEFTKANLSYGDVNEMTILGQFTMMGITTPVQVDTRMELVQKNDQPILEVSCNFNLQLFEKFNVKGPDGPSPAKDVLQFYMNFELIESL